MYALRFKGGVNSRTEKVLTLGLSAPYGSSSLGLKTLDNENRCTGARGGCKHARNRVDTPILRFRTCKVRTRGALRDHLWMNALCNSRFDRFD